MQMVRLLWLCVLCAASAAGATPPLPPRTSLQKARTELLAADMEQLSNGIDELLHDQEGAEGYKAVLKELNDVFDSDMSKLLKCLNKDMQWTPSKFKKVQKAVKEDNSTIKENPMLWVQNQMVGEYTHAAELASVGEVGYAGKVATKEIAGEITGYTVAGMAATGVGVFVGGLLTGGVGWIAGVAAMGTFYGVKTAGKMAVGSLFDVLNELNCDDTGKATGGSTCSELSCLRVDCTENEVLTGLKEACCVSEEVSDFEKASNATKACWELCACQSCSSEICDSKKTDNAEITDDATEDSSEQDEEEES